MNDRPTIEADRLEDPVEVPQEEQRPRGWAPARHGLRASLIFAGIAVAGILLVLYAWKLPPFASTLQTTDNAYVRGQTTVIAPQVSGYVTAVKVQDYQTVTKGQELARIDDRIYRQRVEQAEAQLAAQRANLANSLQSQRSGEAQVGGQTAAVANAQAQLARARADMQRVDDLVKEGSVSLRERDQTLAALRAAEAAVLQAGAQQRVAQEQVRTVTVGRGGLQASVEAAEAAVKLAQIDLANTIIRAPQDGRLGEVGVRLGQYVTAGTQLTFLVPPHVWVAANFKEAQTARMTPGQPAEVRVDALSGAAITGHVERIAPAAGNEFAVIKSDNATGNFVKVPQRITVRIELDQSNPLYPRLSPGMSVEARVDTSGGPAPRQP